VIVSCLLRLAASGGVLCVVSTVKVMLEKIGHKKERNHGK
jgi:hypothetical protein